MTASEIIVEFQKLIAQHGDIEVVLPSTDDYWGDIGYRDVNSVEFVPPRARDQDASVPHQHNDKPVIYIS